MTTLKSFLTLYEYGKKPRRLKPPRGGPPTIAAVQQLRRDGIGPLLLIVAPPPSRWALFAARLTRIVPQQSRYILYPV